MRLTINRGHLYEVSRGLIDTSKEVSGFAKYLCRLIVEYVAKYYKLSFNSVAKLMRYSISDEYLMIWISKPEECIDEVSVQTSQLIYHQEYGSVRDKKNAKNSLRLVFESVSRGIDFYIVDYIRKLR